MTAMRTTADSDAEGTSTLVLAARHLARKLGNPMSVLTRTVRASERLLSIATALPQAAPDPYAALRRVLQAKSGPARGPTRRERMETQTTRTPTTPRARRAAPTREVNATPARVPGREAAQAERSSALQFGAQRGGESAAPATAAPPSPAKSPFTATAFTTNPRSARLYADSASSTTPKSDAVSATPMQPAAAGHDVLAQRRRRLRDGLQMRPVRGVPPGPQRDAPTTATLAALLGSTPLTSLRTQSSTTTEPGHTDQTAALDAAASQPTAMSAPSAANSAERVPTTPASRMAAQAVPPAARSSVQTSVQTSVRPSTLSTAARSNVPSGPSVRRLLPPSSPLDAFGDVPANTLLDAAYRHGVDPL